MKIAVIDIALPVVLGGLFGAFRYYFFNQAQRTDAMERAILDAAKVTFGLLAIILVLKSFDFN
jgi:hypothetical protein